MKKILYIIALLISTKTFTQLPSTVNKLLYKGFVTTRTPSPIEFLYGTYTGKVAALTATSGYRYKGMTIGIDSAGSVWEYQFKGSTSDADLVLKVNSYSASEADGRFVHITGNETINGNKYFGGGSLTSIDNLDLKSMLTNYNGFVAFNAFNSTLVPLTGTDMQSRLGYLTNITSLVTAGTNVTVTGSGTSGSPYVVSAVLDTSVANRPTSLMTTGRGYKLWDSLRVTSLGMSGDARLNLFRSSGAPLNIDLFDQGLSSFTSPAWNSITIKNGRANYKALDFANGNASGSALYNDTAYWRMQMADVATGTTNSGNNFYLLSYNDGTTVTDTSIFINRATGQWKMPHYYKGVGTRYLTVDDYGNVDVTSSGGSGVGGGTGTVTSVSLTTPSWLSVSGSPVTSSGTLAVTAATGQTANQFLSTPNGSTGAVGLRSIVAADIPTLNQSTTGSAATLTTGRTIGITGDVTYTSPSFNGSANVTASATVTKINGTSLAGLSTGILKNTTTTGVPSIAVAADFPTLNQNTTGTAASVTGTNVVSNSNLSQMSANTIKGNNTGSTANTADLTVSQVKTMLSISNVDNTSDATKNSATATLTNKRWTARVGSTTSSATPTINTDNYDVYKLTAQAADITSFTTNLTGTPSDADVFEVEITGTASRAITWGTSFVSSSVTLPTTTSSTTTLTVIFQYYTTSSYGNNKWVCVNSY